MENDLEIPVISYEDIRNIADNFLNQFHPSRDIPVPIEEIIEFQMRKDIIPLIGLHQPTRPVQVYLSPRDRTYPTTQAYLSKSKLQEYKGMEGLHQLNFR